MLLFPPSLKPSYIIFPNILFQDKSGEDSSEVHQVSFIVMNYTKSYLSIEWCYFEISNDGIKTMRAGRVPLQFHSSEPLSQHNFNWSSMWRNPYEAKDPMVLNFQQEISASAYTSSSTLKPEQQATFVGRLIPPRTALVFFKTKVAKICKKWPKIWYRRNKVRTVDFERTEENQTYLEFFWGGVAFVKVISRTAAKDVD